MTMFLLYNSIDTILEVDFVFVLQNNTAVWRFKFGKIFLIEVTNAFIFHKIKLPGSRAIENTFKILNRMVNEKYASSLNFVYSNVTTGKLQKL